MAYNRTSLGLMVAGLAIAGSHTVADAPLSLAVVGVPLVVLSVVVAIAGRRQFIVVQRALCTGAPLPVPVVAVRLPLALAALAAMAALLSALELLASS